MRAEQALARHTPISLEIRHYALMEHSSLDLVKEMWSALDRGDRRTVGTFFAPDLAWHLFAGEAHAMSGDYVGWEENAHLQRLIQEEGKGTFHAEAVSFTQVSHHLVVVPVRVSLMASGEHVAMDGVWIARVEEGRIVEVWDIISSAPQSVLAEAARAVNRLGRLPSPCS